MESRGDFKRKLLADGEDPKLIVFYQSKLDAMDKEDLITLVWKYVAGK